MKSELLAVLCVLESLAQEVLPCEYCNGSGEAPYERDEESAPCYWCHGSGISNKSCLREQLQKVFDQVARMP